MTAVLARSLALALVAASTMAASKTAPPPHRVRALVDDRGRNVEASMNVCATGLSGRVCWVHSEPVPSALLEAPPVEVSVEGPDHGPVSCPLADLASPGVLVVPRKATVRLRAGPQPATLSLYPLGAPDPRKPSHRWPEVAVEQKIPAGRWLASVSVAGLAPRLARVEAPPGSTHEIVRPLGARSGKVRTNRSSSPIRLSSVIVGPISGRV